MTIKKGDLVRYNGSWDGSKFKHGIVTSDPFEMDFKVLGKQNGEKEFINVKWWKANGSMQTQTDSIYNLIKVCEEQE